MDHQKYCKELRLYRSGLALAILMTAVPTLLVVWDGLPATVTFACVLSLVLLQIVVHFYCFLHVGTHRSKRDETGLVLFSALIVLLMVGGTLVVFFDQMQRM